MKRHTLNSSKCGIFGATAILATVGLVGLSFPAMALTEQSDVNVNFTFNSVLGVSVSSNDLSIDDLAPGTAADSNVITVNVLSNSPYGYTLNSTVGSSTYNNRNLTHATVNNATPFSSIDFGTTKASKESFSNSQWGYSFSLDNGTTWINATKTNGTTNDTGYSGLPLYSDSSHIATIKESSSTSALNGDNVKFKIAAKADTTQIAGEYNNVINFQVTGSPAPVARTYMQDLTMADCQAQATNETMTVYDRRDNSDYTIRYMEGMCWMTQNLRITGTISATDSNFTGSDFNTMAGGDLRNNTGSTTTPQSHLADSGDVTSSAAAPDGPYTVKQMGAWYNYCAATAGEICQDTSASATKDICPAGWRLPNAVYDPVHYAAGEVSMIQEALNADFSLWPIWGVLYGGSYYNGSLENIDNAGSWWASTPSSGSSTNQTMLYSNYQDDSMDVGFLVRSEGTYVRCILNS